jgi:hypothetical protein
VHYFERQFLRTQDFVDEQAYHREMQERHQVTEHSWGIVRGLELALNPDCKPVVQPGIAIDGYGRTLILQMGQTLWDQDFDAKGSDLLDVWLAYGELAGEDAPEGYAGCGVDGSAQSYYRTQEQPILFFDAPDPTHPDPRVPPAVPDGDVNFDGTRNAPRSPTAIWPVYLGQAQRKREKPDQPWQYSVSLDGRPYAGLVGEMVRHPTEHAWIEIGTPVGDGQTDTRFAVFLTSLAAQDRTAADGSEDLDPRLEITSAGQISLRGDASLSGNLVIEQGALAFRAQDSQPADDGSQSTHPRPWSIYRAQGEVQVEKALTNPGQGATAPSGNTSITSDLRLEMAGHNSGKSQVVIGAWGKGPDGKEAFQPCLTIDDDCNVTIERNLIVKGFITQLGDKDFYSISGSPLLSPEVRSLLVGNLNSAANASASQPGVASPGGIDLSELTALLDSSKGRVALLDALMSDPNLYRAFLIAFLAYNAGGTSGMQALVDVLSRDPVLALKLVKELLASTQGTGGLAGLISAIVDLPGGPKMFADAVAGAAEKGKMLIGGLMDSDPVMDLLRAELQAGPSQGERIYRLADRIKNAIGGDTAAMANLGKQLGLSNG